MAVKRKPKGGPGRGQGRKTNASKGLPKRSCYLQIRLTPEQKAQLQAEADELGVKIAVLAALRALRLW